MVLKYSVSARWTLVVGFAAALLTGCVSSNPGVDEAESAAEAGRYEVALKNIERAVDRDSSNIEAYALKVTVLRRQADSSLSPDAYADLYRQAQAAEDSIMAYAPGRESKIQERRLRLYNRETERGESAYNRANKNNRPELYRRAATFFGAAGVLQPDSARPVLNEAYAYLKGEQYEEAVPALEAYVERADTVEKAAAKILVQLYLSREQAEQATQLLDRAMRAHPGDQELQALRLKAYNRVGAVDEALLAYREQIEKNPDNANYRFNYGSLLLKAARYADAIEELSRAVALRPEHAESQYNLGAAYLNSALARDDRLTALRERMEADTVAIEQEADPVMTPSQRVDSLTQRRQTLFEKAVPPLERARKLSEARSAIRRDACRALLVAYVQTDRPNKAAQVEDCTAFARAGRR